MSSVREGSQLAKSVKCPKCSSRHLHLIQLWTASTAFSFDANGVCVDAPWYGQDEWAQDIDLKSVEGFCNACKHQWTIRKIRDAVDLVQEGGAGV